MIPQGPRELHDGKSLDIVVIFAEQVSLSTQELAVEDLCTNVGDKTLFSFSGHQSETGQNLHEICGQNTVGL